MSTQDYFYEPARGHGLPHDPFKAIVGPRPIGWISSRDRQGRAIEFPREIDIGAPQERLAVEIRLPQRQAHARAVGARADAPYEQQFQGFVEIGLVARAEGQGSDAAEQPCESGGLWRARGIHPGAEWDVRFHRPILPDQRQEAPQHGAEFLRLVVVFPIDFDLARVAGGELAGDLIAEDR